MIVTYLLDDLSEPGKGGGSCGGGGGGIVTRSVGGGGGGVDPGRGGVGATNGVTKSHEKYR